MLSTERSHRFTKPGGIIMASSISQIKQQVNQIGQQTTSTAVQLFQLSSNLEKNVAVINAAIGGTSNGEDKIMIEAFQKAGQAVKNASLSLQMAAKAAKDWSAKV